MEGDEKTQREFLRSLAREKGLFLNINPPDNKIVHEKYMKGTMDSDLHVLTELILELMDTQGLE